MFALSAEAWPILGLALALGLSHGADPDHLAAIDGITRASTDRFPKLSRWAGAFFAVGHSCSVLTIATLLALAADHFTGMTETARRISTLASGLLLFLIGTLNVLSIRAQKPRHGAFSLATVASRFSIKAIHPILAVPIGLFFGIGFDTASQMAALALAANSGAGHALMIGAAFSSGMFVTDFVNGLIVRRLYVTASHKGQRARQIMTYTVTGLAYGIAMVKLLQAMEYEVPVADMTLTGIVLFTIVGAFIVSLVLTKSPYKEGRTPHNI